jgi:ArsR family transcriptional regulator, arsenate/arsenite/antimonite-responsive transcriptional repressor
MPAKRKAPTTSTEPDLGPLHVIPVNLLVAEAAAPDQRYLALAPAFRALGDPIRLRLLSLIASHPGGEACVCELVGPFDVSQPAISHHLRILREAGLVTSERRGTWVYYQVPPKWISVLDAFLEHQQAQESAAR